MQLNIKTRYEKPAKQDGVRVLVDRLWPRGVSREAAQIDLWAQALAPSHDLRKWFGHDEAKYAEFTRRYHIELSTRTADAEHLIAMATGRPLTLIYSASDVRYNKRRGPTAVA